MPGAYCRPLRALRPPRTLFPGHILDVQNAIPRPHSGCPEPTVGHIVFFEFSEFHSRAAFCVSGAICRPLRLLRVPRTPFQDHILDVPNQLWTSSGWPFLSLLASGFRLSFSVLRRLWLRTFLQRNRPFLRGAWRPPLLAVLISLRRKTEARLRPRMRAVLLSLRPSRSPPSTSGSTRI